ncbi:BASS family bile acid:Na+ symporter [Dysgonomonas hofstadii]|uniref:BASS family bile acid:Na+ symporter n=1 Tax=Dysgonomonas hofstadii TaxID=637886 RepID=A0A840CZS3_9BACT|nr:transporter [Dysgonomonas hofstadii]MBB4037902.1 BASS family bile acid:Na+ symporter [Dysgonomonas hofstadii]
MSYNVTGKIKSYMMPIAMITGGLLHQYVAPMAFLTPYLIVAMLFITYCNISLKDIKFSRLHMWLILIQITGSILVYLLLLPINPVIAQGAMICVLAPTATSAPVITGMLGGNVASLTAYSLLCNMAIIVFAPLAFSFTGEVDASSFLHSLWIVFQKVFALLFFPFFGALLLQKLLPRVHNEIKKAKSISFYLWSVALVIVTGKTIKFVLDQENPDSIVEISIAVLALIICVSQFITGRRLGRMYNDTVAGGQGLGQKNTVLAIWMAQTYLNPISSIGPGAYVLWQNIVNSYQVWRNRKNL